VTIRLTIGSNDRTLKTDEINGCANGVAKKLQKRLNAEMRN
jgi:phenylalanyl-tRNA synthetase beta chain